MSKIISQIMRPRNESPYETNFESKYLSQIMSQMINQIFRTKYFYEQIYISSFACWLFIVNKKYVKLLTLPSPYCIFLVFKPVKNSK